MIEMASWGGSDMKNLQFLAPQVIHKNHYHQVILEIYVYNPRVINCLIIMLIYILQDISEDVFNNLASMLPNIFRVSNPLRLSTSSSSHSLQHQTSN